MVRVLVAHEQRWGAGRLRALFERDAGIAVVGEAAGPGQVVALGQALAPDVVLIGSPALAAEPLSGVATLVLDDEHPAALDRSRRKRAARRRPRHLKLIQGGSSWNSVT